MALVCVAAPALADTPSVSGQTGLISMPDARIAPEGSWRTGMSFLRPYQTLWTSVAVFPWFEGSFRYTRIMHVPGFSPTPDDPDFGANYGDFKDKSFDAKLRLLPERGWWPAIAAGMQDVGGGTEVFNAGYAVASKRLGEFDLSLGYGNKRIDGAFGGVRWTPARLPSWSLVAEYDAYNYPQDRGAVMSGAAQYRKEPALGVEYRRRWWGVKGFAAHDELGFNAYVSVPLEDKEFIPKFREPAPYTKINPRPTEAQWQEDPEHRARLGRALVAQDFREIALGYRNGRLEASLANSRISSMPRAVGRAARTMLSFAPLETRELGVTYRQGAVPVATYTFVNVPLLQRYFNGFVSREQLAPYVAIGYADPDRDPAEEQDRAEALAAFQEPLPEAIVVEREEADLIALRSDNLLGGSFYLRPGFSTFFNDPSGAFRFDLSAVANYDRWLAPRSFLHAQARFPIYEDVSEVTTPSNSELPHVRSDVAEYRREAKLRLTSLYANRFFHPRQRVYARLSAGIFEEMFSGAGGQVLYLPTDGSWGVDVDLNWVRQRDFEGWFGHQDYQTVTAIASLNYRMAQGLTGTLRAGRFLAKDEGVRVEIKRRFASRWEVGAWYTVTNGNDITSPGTPSSPYYDKGIFMVWQLDTLLPRDTRQTATLAISPWTRDVGQMVESPGDLYSLLETPVLQMRERGGLSRFGDRDDDYELPQLGADRRWPDFVAQDLFGGVEASRRIDWFKTSAVAMGAIFGSALLDKEAFQQADKRRNSRKLDKFVEFGDALPIAALGLSGVFAFDESRPRLSDAGVAALEASALALVASEGLKWGVGRARPTTGLGTREFEPGSSEDRLNSFPSRSTAVMWAAVTPYAKEFDLPWLYAVAALTNAARVGSREHWVSDTVAGSLLGYALGHFAWEGRRDARLGKSGPSLTVGPGSVGVAWQLD